MINVTAIKLPETFDSYKNTEEEKLEFLEPVSKINIFVGSNNSGKSRFMRMLSAKEEYEVKQNSVHLSPLMDLPDSTRAIIKQIYEFIRLQNS
jgi:predicted ATPase